jgi:hypothetical protein
VTQWLTIKLLLHAQASVLTSALSKTGACMQVSPARTRDSLGVKRAELKAFGNSEHPSSFWQLHVDPCVLLSEAAMRLFTLVASALGVERLWSGARRTLTDTRRSMTSAHVVQLLLVLMNLSLTNDQALFDRLGVQGSASLAMDFACTRRSCSWMKRTLLQRWQHKVGKTRTWTVMRRAMHMPKSPSRWSIRTRWTGMIEAACACEGLGQSRGVSEASLTKPQVTLGSLVLAKRAQRLWRLSKQMFRLVGGAGRKFKILLFNS